MAGALLFRIRVVNLTRCPMRRVYKSLSLLYLWVLFLSVLSPARLEASVITVRQVYSVRGAACTGGTVTCIPCTEPDCVGFSQVGNLPISFSHTFPTGALISIGAGGEIDSTGQGGIQSRV